MDTLTYQQTLTTCTCYKCGILFAMPAHYHQELRATARDFWCPSGHPQAYVKSTVDHLKEQVEAQKRNAKWWEDQAHTRGQQRDLAQRQARALKGVVTKVKKRVGNGVCPCCTRTFANLARHMTCKHPEYSDAKAE